MKTAKKHLKFFTLTIWILFSRSYDAYCTHTLTPDLSKEANPLVTVAGVSSWSVLLIILGCLTGYALFAFYIRTYKPTNLLPEEKGYSFIDIFSCKDMDVEKAIQITLDMFKPSDYEINIVKRGKDFPR